MTLGDYLERHQLSLRAFARACGVSASSIHRVRNGKVIPNRRLLEAIYRETGGQVTPADLIGVDGTLKDTDTITGQAGNKPGD